MEIYSEEYIKDYEKMKSKEDEDRLFKQARNRVQGKIKGRCVTNKDVIVDQEKEIEQYRKRIKQLTRTVNNLHELNMKWNTLTVTGNEESSIEPLIDYITETFYNDGEVVKEITTYYK